VNERLAADGLTLGLAMNAGMYHQDRRPVGLYVEDSAEAAPIVTREGPGNFGMLPNGVLCLGEGTAAVIESRRFAEDRPACRFATQSGPMLVIEGALHPRFIPGSDFLNVRNGAGVASDGTLWLAISNEPVNFHDFARLFRDELGTPDALYLDGSVSRLYRRDTGRHDLGFPLGPIIGTASPRIDASPAARYHAAFGKEGQGWRGAGRAGTSRAGSSWTSPPGSPRRRW
jgi:uncharacterized protein YigE (DUF2233 family)